MRGVPGGSSAASRRRRGAARGAAGSGAYGASPTLRRQAVQLPPRVIEQEDPERQQTSRSGFAPAHAGLPQSRVHDLLVRALDGTAADAIALAQVLVIAHAGGIVGVVLYESVESFLHVLVRCLQAAQLCRDLCHFAGAQVGRKPLDEVVGSGGALTEVQACELPGFLDSEPRFRSNHSLIDSTSSIPRH